MMVKKNNYELVCYNTDGSGISGRAERVIFPKDVADVKRAVLDFQNLVPRGLGSNIVGGCVPNNSVVMDMKNMNSINFDFRTELVYVEAGTTVKELNERLKAIGCEFPISGEGTIGGMIAMNVPSLFGGYGNIREWIEEIEFVNGRGELINFGKADLGEICGLEGITGIIIGAKLRVISYVEKSASIFQSSDVEEVFSIAKRLRLEKSVVMLRFYSPYFSKLLGFPEKYHVVIGFNNTDGRIKGEEYDALFEKIRKDYYVMNRHGYRDREDPKFLFEKVREFILFLDKFSIPYSADFNLGIVFPYFKGDTENFEKMRDSKFSDKNFDAISSGIKIPDSFKIKDFEDFGNVNESKFSMERQETIKMINRMNGKPGKYGIGIKRKDRVDNLQRRIIRRVKMRHDPFLKLNKGKFIDMESLDDEDLDQRKESLKVVFKENFEKNEKSKFSGENFDAISSGIKIPDSFKIKDFEDFGNVNESKFSKETPGMKMDNFIKKIEEVEEENQGDVTITDNLDKSLMDRILYNKGSDDSNSNNKEKSIDISNPDKQDESSGGEDNKHEDIRKEDIEKNDND